MKHIKPFNIFEGIENNVSIEQFLRTINIPTSKIDNIVKWWDQNRSNIKINLFTFNSPQPIAGVFLGENEVAINSRLPMPPHVKLFLLLHESRHCDQHADGVFMSGYYDTVVNNDMDGFIGSYQELERDANDFAINSMREIGFEREMNQEEMRLRGNEGAGPMVFRMMSDDIRRLNPVDFIDLLKKQIGY